MLELTKKINSTMEEMATLMFKRWFVDFEFPNEDNQPYKSSGGEMYYNEVLQKEIPIGWKNGVLSDICDFFNGYGFVAKYLLEAEIDNCYSVFKMGNIKKGGGFQEDKTKSFIKKDKCNGLDKFVLKKGDILMAMTDMKGNVALLGHTAMMNQDDKFIVNQRVGLLRVNNDIGIGSPYVFLLTNNEKFIEDLRGRANSGVQVNLSTSEIKNSKIVLAPKEINEKFDSIVSLFFKNF